MTEKHAAEVLADQTAAAADAYDLPGVARAAAMLRTIPALEDELMEQARIVGMGAEREARLMARVAELERERDALRADFRRLNEKHTNLHMSADACRKERDALRAEVEALRADAERYRWLRDSGLIAASRMSNGICIPMYTMDEEARKNLDAAIDAARKS